MKLIPTNQVKIGNYIILNQKLYEVESIETGDIFKFKTFDYKMLKRSKIKNMIEFRFRSIDMVPIMERSENA